MFEIVASIVVILLSLPILGLILSKFSSGEQRWMLAGYIGHLMGTVAQIWMQVSYYGYGDMLSYHRDGRRLAGLMRDDFFLYAPEVWLVLIQKTPETSLFVQGVGTTTGSMNALAGYLSLLTFDSLYASCIILSLLAYFGLLAMYSGLRTGVPPELQKRALLSCLLIPSVMLWSSGIIKEAVAIAGLGFGTLALYELFAKRRSFRGVLLLMSGIALMSISKAYLLGPFALGASAWMVVYFARKTKRDIAALATPGYAILGIAVAVISMIAIGEFFPRYSIGNLASEATHLQEVGSRTRGGSDITFTNEPVELSIRQQFMYAPLAITLTLFRPFIFEVRNVFALFTALEASFAMVLLFLALKRRGLRESWRRVLNSPTLVYCLIIVVLLAFGIGLTTTNFGTLSRYRIPMMPMYFVLIGMLLPVKSKRNQRDQKARRGVLLSSSRAENSSSQRLETPSRS